MFETIIALFVKRYLTRYFDINADQLSAQLLYKRQIIIENLTLNKITLNEDIQRKYQLPFEIDSFRIDRIECSLIISSFFFRSSSPAFVIKIHGVHGLVKSFVIEDDDSLLKNFEENDRIKKRHQLNLAEQQLEKEFECFGEVKSSRWNVQRLLMSFFEKLQVEIHDIHISYQSSELCTIGFTCDSIHVSNESSDEMMNEQVFRIINPGVYMNVHNPSTHSYLLCPPSAVEIHLIHNHFLVSQKEYRYAFDCSLNDLTMKCTVEQTRILVEMMRSVQNASLRRMLVSDPSRPRIKLSKQSAKAWWYYAILAVLRTQIDSSTLAIHYWFDRSLLIHRLHQLICYQRFYRAYLDVKYLKCGEFSSEDELKMNEIEKEFDIKYLLIIRRSIFQKRINEQLNQRKESTRWYSNYAKWITTKMVDLWGRNPSISNSIEAFNENDQKLQDQVNTFIAETLEDEDLSENCQNSLVFCFKLALRSMQIDLLSSVDNIHFDFYLKNLFLNTEYRLRHRSIVTVASLEDFFICDHEQIESFSKILCSKERLNQKPMFELSFQKKMKSRSPKLSVYSIDIRSCGLCIFCCPETTKRLHQLYSSIMGPSSLTFRSSLQNWTKIRNYVIRNLASIWEKLPSRHRHREKRKFCISIDMGAPKMIIPLLSSSQSALLVDLGCVIFTSDTAIPEQQSLDEEDDEFLTPDTSPLANDNPLEEENNFYSINVISNDFESQSYSLSICKIQIGYFVDQSQIIESFNINFLIKQEQNNLWTLSHISATIPKLIARVNAQIIQNLCTLIQPWITYIKQFNIKPSKYSSICPAIDFHLDQMDIQLNDQMQTLSDFHIQRIDLSFVSKDHLNKLTFTLEALTMMDCLKQDYILKANQATNTNDKFICLTIFPKNSLTIDINANQFDLIVNPETVSRLINFVTQSNPFSFGQILTNDLKDKANQMHCQMNATFRELNVFFVNITLTKPSSHIHIETISMNMSLDPFLTFDMKIIDRLSISDESTTTLLINNDISNDPALYLSLKNNRDNQYHKSIKLASVFLLHSFSLSHIIQYISLLFVNIPKDKNHLERIFHYLTRTTLSIDLNTLKTTLPLNTNVQLDQIHLRKDQAQSSEYEINLNRISYIEHYSYPFVENIVMLLDFQNSNGSIQMSSKVTSQLRVFLSPQRIKFLQQILKIQTNSGSSSRSGFNFNLQSSQMSIIFQTERNNALYTISEGMIDQCQISYEWDRSNGKKVTLQLASLQIKDHSVNCDQSPIALTFIKLTSHQQQLNIKLGKIDFRLTESSWMILMELIRLINNTNLIEKKKQSTSIVVDVDLISFLLHNNTSPLLIIDLQRFNGQIQTCIKQTVLSTMIRGQLDFISIRDLTTVDQLYIERLCTNSTNAIIFSFNREEQNAVRSQFHVRMPSIQYIHTQDFLSCILDYLSHFQLPSEKRFGANLSEQLQQLTFNIEMENIILALPEHIQKKPVLVIQLGLMNLQNTLNSATMKIRDISFYASSHCLIDGRTSSSIRFLTFGLSHVLDAAILRQPFHLTVQMQYTSSNYDIKMHLSSIDLLFDFNHYHLIQTILTDNLHGLSTSLLIRKNDNRTASLTIYMEIKHVGIEIFMQDTDLLSFSSRRSVSCAILTDLHLFLSQHTNGNQGIRLLCSDMKMIDTRNEHVPMIIPLSIPPNTHRLELYFDRYEHGQQCTITINAIRFLFVVDWLLALNEFLNLFCAQKNATAIDISLSSIEIKLNLDRLELVLVPAIDDPYANVLRCSSTMILHYINSSQPLELLLNNLTFFTCQIGNINETSVSITEPTDCSLSIHTSDELLNERLCQLIFSVLNIRLSYSDIQMIYSLIQTIIKQISQAKTRKPLLTFISSILTSPLRNLQSSTRSVFIIKFLKFICNEICLCLIDDCFGVNIPLLNINLKPFTLETIENSELHRTDQCEFDLIISYYNRFQSGFEPLIEQCPLQMTLTRSSSTTSLYISAKEILNLNFTKAMYRLYDTIQTNWRVDRQQSKKRDCFRRVKPLDPYCFKNLLGVQVKFRTYISNEQCFSSLENSVDDNQTISFCFPTHSSHSTSSEHTNPGRRERSNSDVVSLFQTDRRIVISIGDQWETLQPISIDRVGTFFRLALPANKSSIYKPILIIIDVAMTDNTIRTITIRSSIQIRNQLLTSIEMGFQSYFDEIYELCLEPNETRSLPLQFCSILKQLQIRPANFALDYCDEPIQWLEIEGDAPLEEKAKTRQSFLRSCSIGGKEAVYYVCLQSKQTCLLTYQNQSLSIYQLTILPPLTIGNLLPCTLHLQVPLHPQILDLNPCKYHREHTLNILQELDIRLTTNIYRMNKSFQIPPLDDLYRMKHTCQRVSFYDDAQRELLVDLTIECHVKHRLKILISVPYVLMNKSGIPLIFKDVNSKVEASGQTLEDESMVNREPLLFSYDNVNRNNMCMMRVGTGLHQQQDGRPQWSQRFSLEHGSTYLQLQVRSSRQSSGWNYSIGVDIHPGNGHLKKANFIFFSARYMICNQCSYDLLVAQRPLKGDTSTCLRISKHATVAYHWPRTDMEQLLCVQLIDDQRSTFVHWSGGFLIDDVNVFHINMRNEAGQCCILRVQILERHGTYFVVIMDSKQMPPLFRISNRSSVPIQFYQTAIREELTYLRTIIQPNQSIDYAWDEPTLKPLITCSIPDGAKAATYDLLKLGTGEDLKYQNFIYLVFQNTFDLDNLMDFSDTTSNLFDSSLNQLVIDYNHNRVLLENRQENQRSQLWQMTNSGLLIHVGTTSRLDDIRQAMVLDIEDLTNNTLNNLLTRYSTLTVRRYDPKRALTQTWKLLDKGYLSLANTQLCVQVFGELKPGNDVVLGPIIEHDDSILIATMCIRPQQRYEGTGVLSVRVKAEGPTNVLEIDHKKSSDSLNTSTASSSSNTIYHLDLSFPAGVGLSLIGSLGHEAEELMYALVNNLHIEYHDKNNEQSIEGTIESLIISNQLLTANKPCFLYASSSEDSSISSAIHLEINWQPFNNKFSLIYIIHSLFLNINTITIQLDEVLLWKLIDFFDIEISSLSSSLFSSIGFGNTNSSSDRRIVDLNIAEYETERILSLLTSTHARRFYFNKLRLASIDLNLSVYCTHSKRILSPHLLSIKRRASFPLVPFENAQIHLKSFEQTHTFNTYDFFLLSILTHYINVCKKQALKILGTVDFLGNPLGLIHDVTDGLSCLVEQRSVSGLVKNVAHGVADSTSKVTGSLSHGIGRLVPQNDQRSLPTIDHHHPKNSSLGHAIRHGYAGLAAGFYGGLTSMIKQPYKGVVEEGVPGLMKGFAKGIVGTVSKPMVSILDFTNEMATAIKEGARSSNTILNNRIRLTRCPCDTLGLLQFYSLFDAQGHNLLWKLNKGDSTERYISRLTLSTFQINSTDKRIIMTNNQRNTDAMITTQRVILYRIEDDPDTSKFEILDSYDFHTPFSLLPIGLSTPVSHTSSSSQDDGNNSACIQIIFNSKPSLYRCDTFDQAIQFSREVQRAQDIYQEKQSIHIPSDDEFDE